MKWDRGHRSNDVEDRRGQRGVGGGFSGGSANLLAMLFRTFGIKGVLIGGVLLFVASYFGVLPGSGSGVGVSGDGGSGPATAADIEAEKPLVEFVSFVFDDAQKSWQDVLGRSGGTYQKAKLVLFRDSTQSGCGVGQAQMGPFYCSRDEKVYVDLGFFDELKQRLGAPGDFAQAYVIAHELGHHLQHLLGDARRVHDAPESQQVGDTGLSVRLELQADCYAGVWASGTERRALLEAGDLEEALNAASKIGDDTLQRQGSGAVRPETFTHGSSAQRKRWLERGFKSGDPKSCDTFGAQQL